MAVAGVAQELGLLGGLSVHDAGLILVLVVPEVEGVLTDLLYAGADHTVLHAFAVDESAVLNRLHGVGDDDLLELRGAEGPLVDLLQAVRQIQLLQPGAIEGSVSDFPDRGRDVDTLEAGAAPQQAVRDLLHVLRQLDIGDIGAAIEDIRAIGLHGGGQGDGGQALAVQKCLLADIGQALREITAHHAGAAEGGVADEFDGGGNIQRSIGDVVKRHGADGLDAVGNVQGLDAAGKEEGRTADGLQTLGQGDGGGLHVEVEGLGGDCRHAVGLARIADGRRNDDLGHGGIGAAVVLGLVVLRQEQDRIRAGDLPPQAVGSREDLAKVLALAEVPLHGDALTDRDHAVGGQAGEGGGSDTDGAIGHAGDLTLFVDGRHGLIGGGPGEGSILHGGGIDLVAQLLRLADGDVGRLDLHALRADVHEDGGRVVGAVADQNAHAAGVGGVQGQLLD